MSCLCRNSDRQTGRQTDRQWTLSALEWHQVLIKFVPILLIRHIKKRAVCCSLTSGPPPPLFCLYFNKVELSQVCVCWPTLWQQDWVRSLCFYRGFLQHREEKCRVINSLLWDFLLEVNPVKTDSDSRVQNTSHLPVFLLFVLFVCSESFIWRILPFSKQFIWIHQQENKEPSVILTVWEAEDKSSDVCRDSRAPQTDTWTNTLLFLVSSWELLTSRKIGSNLLLIL